MPEWTGDDGVTERSHLAPAVRLAWGSATDVGAVRTVNEDALLSSPPVFLVADGMGGYAAGDLASAAVVEAMSAAAGQDYVDPAWVLGTLGRVADELRRSIDGGTTVAGAAMVCQEGQPYWMVFNVGDSRVYHSARGAVRQVTVDHSVVQEMVDAGEIAAEDARFHPQRNVITRAIGSPDALRPDLWFLPIDRSGRLMMCSDGVTSELEDAVIREILGRPRDAQQTADELVRAARAAGGRDNISAVVVDVISVAGEDDRAADEDETVPRDRRAAGSDPERTGPRAEAEASTVRGASA